MELSFIVMKQSKEVEEGWSVFFGGGSDILKSRIHYIHVETEMSIRYPGNS